MWIVGFVVLVLLVLSVPIGIALSASAAAYILFDPLLEPALAQEIAVRVHGRRVAVWERHAQRRQRAQHLAERRVLAAHELNVGAAELRERHRIRMHRRFGLARHSRLDLFAGTRITSSARDA